MEKVSLNGMKIEFPNAHLGTRFSSRKPLPVLDFSSKKAIYAWGVLQSRPPHVSFLEFFPKTNTKKEML